MQYQILVYIYNMKSHDGNGIILNSPFLDLVLPTDWPQRRYTPETNAAAALLKNALFIAPIEKFLYCDCT